MKRSFKALVSVVHHETWVVVDAKDEAEARVKINDLHEDVIEDDTGGEVVDWEIISIVEGG